MSCVQLSHLLTVFSNARARTDVLRQEGVWLLREGKSPLVSPVALTSFSGGSVSLAVVKRAHISLVLQVKWKEKQLGCCGVPCPQATIRLVMSCCWEQKGERGQGLPPHPCEQGTAPQKRLAPVSFVSHSFPKSSSL